MSKRRAERTTLAAHAADARTWAREIGPGTPVDWRALEVAALRDHPDVLEQLDPDGRHNDGKRYRGRTARQLILATPLMLLGAAVIGSPVWGFATLFSQSFRSTRSIEFDERLAPTGVLFAVAMVVLISMVVSWLVGGRRSDSFVKGYAALVLVLGGLSAGAGALGGSREGVPGWGLWTTVIGGAALAGGVTLILFHVLKRPAPQKVQGEPLGRVRRRVEELPPERREAVRDDLAAAVRDLAARGVVDDHEARRALEADVGHLAHHMSQRRTS